MRSPNFWFVFKHGLMAIPATRLIKRVLKEVAIFAFSQSRQLWKA